MVLLSFMSLVVLRQLRSSQTRVSAKLQLQLRPELRLERHHERHQLRLERQQLRLERQQLRLECHQLRLERHQLRLERHQLRLERHQLRLERHLEQQHHLKTIMTHGIIMMKTRMSRKRRAQLSLSHKQLSLSHKRRAQLSLSHKRLSLLSLSNKPTKEPKKCLNALSNKAWNENRC